MSKIDLISIEKIEKPFVELNRSQFVTGSQHCDPRSRPYAFEQGVVVLRVSTEQARDNR